MPIYEFECAKHGVFERILPISFANQKTSECDEPDCLISCERVWSRPGNIQIGQPTRMFINQKNGEVFSPFSRFDKPPAGYKEIELKGPTERSKFEKEQQRRTDAQNQYTSHMLDTLKNESRKRRHDDLSAKMNAVQREVDPATGETVEFTLETRDKELLKRTMNRTKKRPAREKKSEMMLAVNHFDKNNMDQMKNKKDVK